MDRFLHLPDERRRVLCEEAGRTLGLSAGSVEKDFWAYDPMREAMFFDQPPTFDEILAVVAEFEREFNGP